MSANIELGGVGRADEDDEPKRRVRLCIATPTQGASTVFPHLASLRRVVWAVEQNGADATEFLDEWVEVENKELLHYPTDVVRSRSRMVRLIQRNSKATHVLWLDDDMSFDPRIVVYIVSLMIKYDLDCVGAVYPRKFFDAPPMVEKIRWALDVEKRYEDQKGHIIPPPPTEADYARAKKVLANPLRFAFKPQSFAVYGGDTPADKQKGPRSPHPWLWQLDGLGMGLMVTSRRMLDALTEHYREELFVSDADPQIADMVAIFMLEITDKRHLLSEDNAMMHRWRRMNRPESKIYGYVGPGQVIHHGSQAFEADVSCLLGEEFAQAIEKMGEPKPK